MYIAEKGIEISAAQQRRFVILLSQYAKFQTLCLQHHNFHQGVEKNSRETLQCDLSC